MLTARAGIRSHINKGKRGITDLLSPKSIDEQKCFCWIPLMLGPCVGSLVGLVVLLGGAAMSAVGYYAEYFSLLHTARQNETVTIVDSNKELHLNNLSFLGPVLMGFGCFMMVVACVVICEKRDKDIKNMIADSKLRALEKKGNKKNKFYNSVLTRLKPSHLDGNKMNKAGSGLSQVVTLPFPSISYSNVNKTFSLEDSLNNIPMELFVMHNNMDLLYPVSKRRDPFSLFKKYKDGLSSKNIFPLRKCPSDSFLSDLNKSEKIKLDELWPDITLPLFCNSKPILLNKSETAQDVVKCKNAQREHSNVQPLKNSSSKPDTVKKYKIKHQITADHLPV